MRLADFSRSGNLAGVNSSPTTSANPAAKTVSPAGTAATADDTREAFVRRTRRGYTSVRHVFVQKHSGPDRPSTLARFCRNRKKRALVLYLLLLTVWQQDGSPFRSEVWLRGLNVDGGKVTWSKSSLSTAWSSLVDMGMATRTRTRRMADLTPKREDGAEDYNHPDGKTTINHYFALPGEFWTEKWFDTLSLPAICVLLVLLKESNEKEAVQLTYKQFDDWYGISVSSAQKGIGELRSEGLLDVRVEYLKAALAAEGFTQHHHYKLTGPFSTAARTAARGEASAGAQKHSAKTAAPSVNTTKKSGSKSTAGKALKKPAAKKAKTPPKKTVVRRRARTTEES